MTSTAALSLAELQVAKRSNWRPDISTEEIVRKYLAGESSRTLAAEFDCSQRTIFLRLRNAGIETRHNQRQANASYDNGHHRVRKDRGNPAYCEHCGSTDPGKYYEWASVSHNYGDPSDYIRLCKPCHVRYDDIPARVSAATLGRARPDLQGSKHPMAKLNEADVAAIRARQGESPTALAREFGVTDGAIILIWKRKTWRHVA